MSIAKRNRAERRAEWERARDLNKPAVRGPEGEDHGLDLGPAAQARPSSMVRVAGKLGGAGQRAATPVYARMIDCTDLFERLNLAAQITDRQCAAGKRMLGLKLAAGLEPRVTAKHEVVRDDQDGQETPFEDVEVVEDICPPEYDPRTYFRHLLRQLPSVMADMVVAACDWDPERSIGHPGTARLATFQQALDKLADVLGLKRQGVGV